MPGLDDVKKKIEAGRSSLDNLMLTIPGFSGYVQRTEKYDADKMVRDFLAEKILMFKREVGGVMADFQKKGESAPLAELDSLSMVLEGTYKKCKYADYGGNSSYSRVKVTLEDQDKILAHDWNLLGGLDDIAAQVKELGAQDAQALPEKIRGIKTLIEGFEKNFDARKNVILEVF